MQCAPMQASQRRSWAEECVCVELSKSIGADEVVIGMNIEENIIAWAIRKNLMCIHMYTIMKFYILSLIFKAQHKKNEGFYYLSLSSIYDGYWEKSLTGRLRYWYLCM